MGGKHEYVVTIQSQTSHRPVQGSVTIAPASDPVSLFFFFTFVFLLFQSSQFSCCFQEMDEILYI